MNPFFIIFAVVFLAAAVTVSVLTVAGIKSVRSRPTTLAIAGAGWCVLSLVLVLAGRTPLLYRPILELAQPNRSPSVAVVDTAATDTTDTGALAAFDRTVAAATATPDDLETNYASLLTVRNGRIRKLDYEKLGSARKDLVLMRLEKAASQGDAIAQQALKDIASWQTAR